MIDRRTYIAVLWVEGMIDFGADAECGVAAVAVATDGEAIELEV